MYKTEYVTTPSEFLYTIPIPKIKSKDNEGIYNAYVESILLIKLRNCYTNAERQWKYSIENDSVIDFDVIEQCVSGVKTN